MTAGAVADVTDATFADEVIAHSHRLPVVVDFWAPWCGPCRVLGPTLEALAGEYEGRVRLVKVNVDENPQVAARYRVQGIPAVKAFQDGAVASEFTGALPEPQVRTFFELLVPSEADHAVAAAERERALGDDVAARALLESALAADPGHADAALALADLLAASGDPAAAERAGALASPHLPDPRARRALGRLALAALAAGGDRAALEGRLAADPDDAAAHYALGGLLAHAGEWEAALGHLLATARLDRSLDGDGGRLRMLDAFAVLGDEHELTAAYRRRLANVVF